MTSGNTRKHSEREREREREGGGGGKEGCTKKILVIIKNKQYNFRAVTK